MTHADDARDSELLEDGDIAALLARYEPVIRGRCIARLKGHLDADDVAQDVRLRLLTEFRKGKRWSGTPFRVVVHNVVKWTLADYFAGRPTEAPLPDAWEAALPDDADEVLSHYYLATVFQALPPRQRQVCELRYLEALDHRQIAEKLGIERGAVDVALFRGHEKLRELVEP